MQVRIYATLRPLVGSNALELDCGPGATIHDALVEIVTRWPQLQPELYGPDGELSGRIHVFLNGRDVRYMDGPEMVIPEGADLRIFPPVGGGA